MRILAMAALTVSAYGATYYVSGSGSDSNNGLSVGAPFRTIQAAANLTLPGDVQITVWDSSAETRYLRAGSMGASLNAPRGTPSRFMAGPLISRYPAFRSRATC